MPKKRTSRCIILYFFSRIFLEIHTTGYHSLSRNQAGHSAICVWCNRASCTLYWINTIQVNWLFFLLLYSLNTTAQGEGDPKKVKRQDMNRVASTIYHHSNQLFNIIFYLNFELSLYFDHAHTYVCLYKLLTFRKEL